MIKLLFRNSIIPTTDNWEKKSKKEIENLTARFQELYFIRSIQINNDRKCITKIHSDIVFFSFHTWLALWKKNDERIHCKKATTVHKVIKLSFDFYLIFLVSWLHHRPRIERLSSAYTCWEDAKKSCSCLPQVGAASATVRFCGIFPFPYWLDASHTRDLWIN